MRRIHIRNGDPGEYRPRRSSYKRMSRPQVIGGAGFVAF
jgi:hypothetical protein